MADRPPTQDEIAAWRQADAALRTALLPHRHRYEAVVQGSTHMPTDIYNSLCDAAAQTLDAASTHAERTYDRATDALDYWKSAREHRKTDG